MLGYTGVGGIAGMMYNGEIAGSYNNGYIRTTRQINGKIDSLNMGGIVGDTTEDSNAEALLYDVYNKGQIGDETFTYYGRHVGGIVGRLSGTVEKAYNTGAIYNGYNVVGGIAGWMAQGSINNAFNTGNITVVNNNENSSQVGGIAGGVDRAFGDIDITNVYNLGTLRSFRVEGKGKNTIGGILGESFGVTKNHIYDTEPEKNGLAKIKNAYTTGNIYAGGYQYTGDKSEYKDRIGSIYANGDGIQVTNTYYIKPDPALIDENSKPIFTELGNGNDFIRDNSNKAIEFSTEDGTDDKDNKDSYKYVDNDNKEHSLFEDDAWRIYDGTTPILNAFMPNSKDYFDSVDTTFEGIGNIQYGTAYDPLLTIITANAIGMENGLNFNWQDLGINNDAGLVVYGAGLTLDDFIATGGTGYFTGLIYSDGALTINSNTTGKLHNDDYTVGDISLGSGAELYGSSVTINADGKVTIYGDVTATGNTANGATKDNLTDTINVANPGNITITAGDVDVYGQLTSAEKGQAVSIPGINSIAKGWTPGDVNDPYKAMSDLGNRFAYTTGASAVDGNITIKANGTTDKDGNLISGGDVNLYFGNQEQGLIITGGNLNVEATGDVYVDSDLDIGGDLTLTSNGANSEVVLDLTNIGQVQAKNGTVDDAVIGLHNFMHHFSDTAGGGAQAGNKTISLNSASGDSKITVDMWDYENDKFDLKKYDETTAGGHTFRDELNHLNLKVDKTVVANDNVKDHIYIWVSDGEQLQGINNTGADGLGFNYALKGDINASPVEDYVAIGTGSDTGFTGTFDGRGNRIIGLNVSATDSVNNNTNAGLFSTVGTDGVVKDVNIYSGNFTGTTNAGAVAGINNGRIEGVKTFGNTVKSNGNAGGIVGVNTSGEFSKVDNTTGSTNGGKLTGGIYDVESTGSVIAGSNSANAGGLVGTNGGALGNSFSDSAVTVQTGVSLGASAGLGGVVGVNNGDVQIVDSLGVTNGGDRQQ